MPPKIRELIAELERNGFVNRGGRGSHRNFEHPTGLRVTISGKGGEMLACTRSNWFVSTFESLIEDEEHS